MTMPDRLDALVREDSPLLFAEFVEPLSDAFEPASADRYVELFLPVIERVLPEAGARRARTERRFAGPDPDDVFVLSRVTLGADVAVTSVILAAAKVRFPDARIHLVGPRKNYELFEGDARIGHAEVEYGRGAGLRDRLAAGLAVRAVVDRAGAMVIDPDSRLTQLGLIPVIGDDRYFFWESRSYRPESADPLGRLAGEWMRETFGVEGEGPYVAPLGPGEAGRICVSLGVGGNMAKRVDDRFEVELMRAVARLDGAVLVDHGAGGEESERVGRAAAGLGFAEWRGAFARFAASIGRARLYVGYDSAGQHVAAAAGVPAVTVFCGYPNERFLRRWMPWGRGGAGLVISAPPYLERVVAAIAGR